MHTTLAQADTGLAIVDLAGKPLAPTVNPIESRWDDLRGISQVRTPALIIRPAAHGPARGTMLIFPGGGYHALAIDHEGLNVADFLNAQGYDVAILEYTIGSGQQVRERALADAQAATSLVRRNGTALGLHTDSLAVMGFSAGGHLAARLLHDLGPASPFARIVLVYPAYLVGDSGLTADILPAPAERAPLLVIVGEKDDKWLPGSKAYAEAARAQERHVEIIVEPGAGHGFGMKKPGAPGYVEWATALGKFLAK